MPERIIFAIYNKNVILLKKSKNVIELFNHLIKSKWLTNSFKYAWLSPKSELRLVYVEYPNE